MRGNPNEKPHAISMKFSPVARPGLGADNRSSSVVCREAAVPVQIINIRKIFVRFVES